MPPNHGTSLPAIEAALTLIAVAVAFASPRLGERYFSHIERLFKSLAHRKGLSVAVVGAAAFLLRLALLPMFPVPQPFVQDDFSFLLAADTFASGRLTNPTPAMWQHFESFHITMQPSYMSMYFPAQGLILAVGKLLTGHPWFGLLAVTALMCAAICWMLQAWLPPGWALLGGLIAVLRLGLFSYWINTYTGGGSIAALGGALVLGAFPRLMRGIRLRHGSLMAIGIVLLATSRPYEGLLLCLPIAFVLARWAFSGNNRPPLPKLSRRAALPLLLIVASGAWMGYYNYRVFGSPLTPPYKLDRATYAIVPYWAWQPLHPQPVYRHAVMREFYCHDEVISYKQNHNLLTFWPRTFMKAVKAILFFAGFSLFPPLIMLRRILLDRRTRLPVVCMLVAIGGMAMQIFLLPHYLAPFTALFYVLGLQATRHLRIWELGGQPVGRTMVRLIVTLCFLMGGLRLYAAPLHLAPKEWPQTEWLYSWYGPEQFGAARAHVRAELEHLPGKQLAIVRYSPDHETFNEWVYNAADIDNSKVIWAREMDRPDNLALIHYYKDRTVWLVQPDLDPATVTPYPTSDQSLASLR